MHLRLLYAQVCSPALRLERRFAAMLLLAAAAVVTVTLLNRATIQPAPRVAALPLTADEMVVAQHVGGNRIAPSRYRYRYMAVVGKAGQTRTSLIANEITVLRHKGWTVTQSTIEAGRRQPHAVAVPVTAPGAAVVIDSPNQTIYADLATARSVAQDNFINLARFLDSQIERALRQHRPVLLVTLSRL